MQKYGLFDSPSFITCSDSNSDENSADVHQKKQTAFNVPLQKCKVNLRRVFGRTKELTNGNPLKDYLMRIQLPVVTSTPVNKGSPVVCDSLLKLTPIRKNRNSNIASQFVKNQRRSLNNNSSQTLNKRRKSRRKRKSQSNSKNKHRKVELTQNQALKDEDLVGIEPLYKSCKLNLETQSLTSETSQLNRTSDVLETPQISDELNGQQNIEKHKPSKAETDIEIQRVLSDLDTTIAKHLSIISLSSTLKNVKPCERKIILLSDRKLRSSSKNNTDCTSTKSDLKLQQSSATGGKSKRKIESVPTNEEMQVNCKPDVQSKRKRTLTVKENLVRDISEGTAVNSKSKMKESNSIGISIEASLNDIKSNKESNETELVKSKQDTKPTNEKNYSSVLPTVNEEIRNESEDETLKATEHSPLKLENIKSAEKSKQTITKKQSSIAVLENEKIQDVHEVDPTLKSISDSPSKDNTELHVKPVEKPVKSKRVRNPKTEKAIPQPRQEETVDSKMYSSDSTRYGLRSNTRKQQSSTPSVVLQQYIVNRKSGFIEVCDRTSFDDNTKDSVRGNGRLRRNVKKPQAYVQATYCSSNVYKILGKSTARRRTNNNIDKTRNLEAEKSSDATEKRTARAAKTKKVSQTNKKNAKKQTQDLGEKQMPVLDSISTQFSLTVSSASNTIEKRTATAAKTKKASQTNKKNANKQTQDLDEKQMSALESISKPSSLTVSLASNTSSVAGPTTRTAETKKESREDKNNAKKRTQDLVEKKMPVLESISEQLSSTVSLASYTSGEYPNEDCFKRPTGRAVKKSKTQKTRKDAKELFFSSVNPSNDSVLHSSLGLDEVYDSNNSDTCPNKQLTSNNGSLVSLNSSKHENTSAELINSRSSTEKYPSSDPKRVTVHQNIALKNMRLRENAVGKPFNSKNCKTQSSESEIDKRRTKEIIQCVVNNRTTVLEWYCSQPNFDERQNVDVVYGLTNLKSHMGVSSCGYVRFGPGEEKSQVPRKYVITYKVENGSALVSQQFVTKEMTTGMIFYIPLGSPYRIKNLSKTEPLILYFCKISQM